MVERSEEEVGNVFHMMFVEPASENGQKQSVSEQNKEAEQQKVSN